MDDDDLRSLVQSSVRQALVRGGHEVAGALAEFGWAELAASDEAFAHSTLFEEQGLLSVDTDALDVAAAATLGVPGGLTVVWPHRSTTSATAADDGLVQVRGIALGPIGDRAGALVAPVAGTVVALTDVELRERPLGGMAADTAWVGVTGRARCGDALGAWEVVERRSLLALASELVGVSQHILDVAAEQVTTRRQFGRPIGTYQAVRFRLAEAYAETAGARALVASAWEDGSLLAARAAKAGAGLAHDAVAKHAIQVCGAIGLSEEHPLPGFVRRGFALDALLAPGPFVAHGEAADDTASPLEVVRTAVAVGGF